MAALAKIDQVPLSPGVAGQARDDVATGAAVTLTAAGGPFGGYLWVVDYLAVDASQAGTIVRATSALTAPTSSVTQLTPIDKRGTYAGRLLVDSGAGLGAGVDDVAYWSFYAGVAGDPVTGALASDPTSIPRRVPAAGERAEHNSVSSLYPGGNPLGWAYEWLQWFAVIERLFSRQLFAAAVVTLTSGGASISRKIGVASVTRNSVGNVTVAWAAAFPDALYGAFALPIGATGGSCVVSSRATGTCVVERGDPGGSLADASFVVFAVLRFGL